MTIDECKKYLPNRWAEIIQQDPLLMEIFEEHDYDLEEEAVPPFLFQELRGGNIEHLRPIFALYGQTGLNMLQELLEIDEISKDTAKVELPDEQTSYAGYFFTRFSEDNRQNAENAVQAYIRNINRIFVEEFKEAAPLDENAKIEILFGQAAQTFREEAYQQQINGESTEIEIDLIDWCSDMLYKEGYEDIELMTEALYHILLYERCTCFASVNCVPSTIRKRTTPPPVQTEKAADPSQVSGLSVCAYSAAFSCALWYCRVYSW